MAQRAAEQHSPGVPSGAVLRRRELGEQLAGDGHAARGRERGQVSKVLDEVEPRVLRGGHGTHGGMPAPPLPVLGRNALLGHCTVDDPAGLGDGSPPQLSGPVAERHLALGQDGEAGALGFGGGEVDQAVPALRGSDDAAHPCPEVLREGPDKLLRGSSALAVSVG